MDILPPTLQRLIDQLTRFPGIGRKSAQRMALSLLQWEPEAILKLSETLKQSTEVLTTCPTCHILMEGESCPVCSDPRRVPHQLCVVADTVDVLALEKTGRYRGLYHVLGGLISPLEGIGPEELSIADLKERASGVRELILALNPSVEGETTALYLVRLLKRPDLKITRLAQGVPMGSELEYLDELTLGQALEARRPLE